MTDATSLHQIVQAEIIPLEKRRGGRPRGLPKTGGRKKGVPNRVTGDQRLRIAKIADPLGFLAAVVNGKGKRVEGMAITPEMRVAAALKLAEKLLPNAKDPDGPTAPDVTLDDLAARNGSDPRVELARRAAWLLLQGQRAQDEQADADPYASRAPSVAPPEPEPDEPALVAQVAPVSAPEPAPEPKPYKHVPGLRGPVAFSWED